MKSRNMLRAELIGANTCRAAGLTATGSAPVLALCRNLIAAGLDPDQALEVYRSGMMALRVRSLAAGAALTVEDDSRGTPRFRPWRGGRASPVRQTKLPATGPLPLYGAAP